MQERTVTLSSLDKALVVMEEFGAEERSRGISDIARKVGLPKSTVHRILQTLLRAGYVTQLAGGRYQLGPRIFELGSVYFRDTSLRRAALPHAHDLYNRTKLTVFLSVRDGNEILHLDHIPGTHHAEAIDMTVGRRWSLHTSSAGKLFLAYASPSFLERYVNDGLEPLTKASIVRPELLLDELRRIRRDGYSCSRGEGVDGLVGVSAPIFHSRNQVVAAICLASHGQQALKQATAVVGTAKRITAALRVVSDADTDMSPPTGTSRADDSGAMTGRSTRGSTSR